MREMIAVLEAHGWRYRRHANATHIAMEKDGRYVYVPSAGKARDKRIVPDVAGGILRAAGLR